MQRIKDLAYQLTRKRVDEAALAVCDIRLTRYDLSFFTLSTNTILSFYHEGQLWYFRECPQIMQKDLFWEKAIDDFFDSLDRLHIREEHFAQEIPLPTSFSESIISTFRAYLDHKRQNAAFQRALSNADRIAHAQRYSIWAGQTNRRAFLESFDMHDLPEQCADIAVSFLWNMRAAADRYRKQHIVCGKQHSFFAATKAMASQIVAEELGLAGMITPSKWCRLSVEDDRVYFGLLSASAPGHRMADAKIPPNASLQKELLDLNLLDAICHQPDHGPNNYHVHISGTGSCSVCAFDNDNSQTFFPWMSASHALSGCSPFVYDDRHINRPYLARSTANHLQQVDIKRLRQRLTPYLNRLQIAALIRRLRVMQRAILSTDMENPHFLLDDTQWREETVAEEISGKYGQTYLSRLKTGRQTNPQHSKA